MKFEPDQRVRQHLFMREPVDGTIKAVRDDGTVVVQFDNEPHARRIVSKQTLTLIDTRGT